VNLYAVSPESLWSSPSFVRFMAYSGVAHVAALVLVIYGPIFRFPSEIPPEYIVTVNLGMDAPPEPAPPEPEPAPPEPAPPEPAPPEPKPPEPEPPPPPRQEVEEAMYVPDVPSEKPKPPKPPKPPKAPEQKPKPKAQDVADVMESLRQDVQKRNPAPAPRQGGPVADAELAGYMNAVRACMTINWVGAQQFLRRRGLQVVLLVEVNEAGRVQSVQVERGSGVDAFDDSAERAVLKCSPSLPPPPSGRSQIPVLFNPGENE
jgi:periplasmic protein TonB